MKRLQIGLFLFLVCVAEVSAADPASVKKVIGPAGGEVLLQGTRTHVLLEVPPGAVSSGAEFAIEQISSPSIGQFEKEGAIISDTFRFEAYGLILQKPVSLVFHYAEGAVPSGVDPEVAARLYKKSSDGRYVVEKGAICRRGDGVAEPAMVCGDPAAIVGTEQAAAYTTRHVQGVDTLYSAISLSVMAVAGDRTVYLPYPEKGVASP